MPIHYSRWKFQSWAPDSCMQLEHYYFHAHDDSELGWYIWTIFWDKNSNSTHGKNIRSLQRSRPKIQRWRISGPDLVKSTIVQYVFRSSNAVEVFFSAVVMSSFIRPDLKIRYSSNFSNWESWRDFHGNLTGFLPCDSFHVKIQRISR